MQKLKCTHRRRAASSRRKPFGQEQKKYLEISRDFPSRRRFPWPGSYLAGWFAVWREFRTPLLTRLKASRRPLWPARESCRPGPMSVTLRPARSGPHDRIGVRRRHDRRRGRPRPAAAQGGPRRTGPHRPSRRPGGRPAPTANRRSGRSCSTPTRPGGRNICQLHEMPGEAIPTGVRSRPPLPATVERVPSGNVAPQGDNRPPIA